MCAITLFAAEIGASNAAPTIGDAWNNNNDARADFACLFEPCIVFSRNCHTADTFHFQNGKLHLHRYQPGV